MTTRMLINATVANELRIAIVEDGELSELDIEATEQSSIRGNIYKGVVHNVESSLAAAFIDIGSHKQGFLPFDYVSPSQYYRKWTSKEHPQISEVVRRGQEIIVQVAKDAVGDKGATLTTFLSIPGRYSVLMPESEANGISRKIDDDKVRRRIRATVAKMTKPENCGFIVRTAGLGQTRAALQKDLDSVAAVHSRMLKASQIARPPSILYAEPDLIARTLRDYFNDEIDEVWIDNKEEFEGAKSYFEDLMPEFVERLHWYQNPIPIFAYYRVEEQIEDTFERGVPLPSGGSIVIDQTEALVAVDVNSGKMTSERGHEDTVFKTNCEAAEEAARQLKLRDLGGIVVIDFIDMELTKNKREVEKVLMDASKEDKARFKISRINSKGLCVLTRQRIRQGMRRAFQRRCEVCSGTGWLRTSESHALSLLRRVESRLAQGGVGEARVLTHRETAEFLQNFKRSELLALERNYSTRIVIQARAEMDCGKDEVSFLSRGEVLAEITDMLPPREERRAERMTRRKKRAKQKRAAAEPPSNADEEEREAAPAKTRKRRPERKKKPAVAAAAGRFDGAGAATFTGKPPAELLEKLKAERRARLSRRGSDTGTAPEKPLSSPQSPVPMIPPPPPQRLEDRPPPRVESEESVKQRRSLLDRIFGAPE